VRVIFLFPLLFFFSCGSVQFNGEGRFRIEKIGYIKENCEKLLNSEVLIDGIYRGWNCPKECGAPPVTRSDVCITDSTGCIYSTPFLSPIGDSGKRVVFLAKVKEKEGSCYLKAEKVYEVR